MLYRNSRNRNSSLYDIPRAERAPSLSSLTCKQTAKVQAGREKAVFVSEKVDKEVDWTWEREEKSIKNQLNTLIEEINLIIDSFRLELNELSSEVTE